MKKWVLTLIEVTIGLVILAFLVTIYAPEYVNFAQSERIKLLEETAQSMRSTALQIKKKADAQNVKNGSLELHDLNISVNVFNGYVEGYWNGAWRYIISDEMEIPLSSVSAECVAEQLCGIGKQLTAPGLPLKTNHIPGLVLIWPTGLTIDDECYAYYYNQQDGLSPAIGTVTVGC